MKIMELFDKLFPICRSITGDGIRETLKIISQLVPLDIKEYPSGLKVFDWTIPKEWNIKDAYVQDNSGSKIIDFKHNNLHLLSYSIPVDKTMQGKELKKYIYTLPDMPDAIPYLTSYYKEAWGFCLEHKRLNEIKDNENYHVIIDSSLENGHLTLADGYIKGQTDDEIILSTYICHPSMANNELSGPIVQTYLYKYLLKNKNGLKYSYRFIYLPETIGSITYLAHYGQELKEKVKAGFVITCCGDDGNFTYKRSRQQNSLADRAALNYLKSGNIYFKDIEWFPSGSDERQYCSIGFNLPVGSLMKTMYGNYAQYHTSLDNKDFISEQALEESIQAYIDIIENIEINGIYTNQNPFCEPQLGKRGLYPSLGSQKTTDESVKKLMYLLAYSDGKTDLIEIADKLGIQAKYFDNELKKLINAGLLK